MAEAATLGDLYYPLVAAFQLLLAALFLGTSRPGAVRAAFAVVLVVNALEALDFFALGRGATFVGPRPADEMFFLYLVDGFITLTLPYLASQFPAPLGGAKGARRARDLWIGSLVAWAGIIASVVATPGVFHPWLEYPGKTAHEGALVLTGAVLALHAVPRTLALRDGPLRSQSLLVVAGLGVGVCYALAVLGGTVAGLVAARAPIVPLLAGFGAAALWFLPVLLLRASWAALRAPRRDAALLAGALGLGAAVGFFDTVLQGNSGARPTNELLSQTFRPLLFALALARYGLFDIPRRLRRPLVQGGAVLFALGTFVLVAVLASGVSLQAAGLNPVAALLALLVLAVGVLAFQGPLGEVLAAGDPGDAAERRGRLERYRLALERARQDPGGADAAHLEALRTHLGITRAEHDALASVLEGNLVIPAAALLGAPPGHVVAGRYEVLRELGQGGQGRVLLARDRDGGGEVVLKEVLRPWEKGAEARRAALRRDAEASARVRSRHVAHALGLVEERWQTYFVREYVEGETLEARVARTGPLAPEEAVGAFEDVLAGLAALHGAGVLHLDVKPANLVLRADGSAVLIDQGAASFAPAGPADATVTQQPGGSALTVRWAAPEQRTGGPLTPAADLFQVAGVLVFALTGRPPADLTDRSWAEEGAREARPPALPAPLEGVFGPFLRRALRRDPAERFQDAAEMRTALGFVTRARSAVPPGDAENTEAGGKARRRGSRDAPP